MRVANSLNLPVRILSASLGVLGFLAADASAATITVNYTNGSDGFHSADAVDPASPALGANLGEQRKASFEAAAAEWEGRLSSGIAIIVDADMVPLSCNASSAVLGSAGAEDYFADWLPGVGGSAPPLASTFYPVALANKIANKDNAPASSDIGATFNSDIDNNNNCLNNTNWYYDTAPGQGPGGTISFYDVVLHEIGHGLGVATVVDLTTGAKPAGIDDVYMANLEDHSTGKDWPSMSNAERSTSATDDGDLHWIGANVTAAIGTLSAGTAGGHVKMYGPSPLALGSSVSHFDTSVFSNDSKDELMEPFATPTASFLVTDELLEDLGWGTVTPVELEAFSIE